MTADRKSESSKDIRERVIKAREIQKERFSDSTEIHNNAMISSSYVKQNCKINAAGKVLLKTAMDKLGAFSQSIRSHSESVTNYCRFGSI